MRAVATEGLRKGQSGDNRKGGTAIPGLTTNATPIEKVLFWATYSINSSGRFILPVE